MLQAESSRLKIFKVLLLTKEFEKDVLNREISCITIYVLGYHFLNMTPLIEMLPSSRTYRIRLVLLIF